MDVTVSNDSAILYDCLITFYWHEEQLHKSVIPGGLSLGAIRQSPAALVVSLIWEGSV